MRNSFRLLALGHTPKSSAAESSVTAAAWHPIALGQRALGRRLGAVVCEGLLLLPLRYRFSASVFRPGLNCAVRFLTLQN